MSVIGHWIGESFIVRWAELTHEISNKLVELGRWLVGFSGYDPENWQEPAFAGPHPQLGNASSPERFASVETIFS
ncbi:MAG: hypothetical protein ACP5VS_18235 [Desulfomonilaceae bacterium]